MKETPRETAEFTKIRFTDSLDWPADKERTDRPEIARFGTCLREARDGLMGEIRLMVSHEAVIGCAIRLDDLDAFERSGTYPGDRGVCVRLYTATTNLVFACDRWTSLCDNVQAIRLTLSALRGMSRWQVECSKSERPMPAETAPARECA